MIEIKLKPREVVITGHAKSDVKGKDLVCCAVSTLYYSLIANLLHYTNDIEYDGEEGHARVFIKKYNAGAARSYRFFKIAIKELEKKYPTFIKIL
jgi:hypothetical protein